MGKKQDRERLEELLGDFAGVLTDARDRAGDYLANLQQIGGEVRELAAGSDSQWVKRAADTLSVLSADFDTLRCRLANFVEEFAPGEFQDL